jgi:putative tryptophan/tyrosine transport system substrate-binding protein
MSCGVDLLDLDRGACVRVDKILKGRKQADLPIQQPMKFEFAVNLDSGEADRSDDPTIGAVSGR